MGNVLFVVDMGGNIWGRDSGWVEGGGEVEIVGDLGDSLEKNVIGGVLGNIVR